MQLLAEGVQLLLANPGYPIVVFQAFLGQGVPVEQIAIVGPVGVLLKIDEPGIEGIQRLFKCA